MRHEARIGVVVLVVLAGGAAVSIAVAQDALGDGRALDANLRQGSGGRNQQAPNFRTELEFRNAIVTGNAPGSFAFRGEVGYTAENDFRGDVAGDDIFRFQVDSFYSGLATRNLSGVGAVQNSLAFSVAGQSASYFSGPLIVNRGGAATSAEDVTGEGSPVVRTDVFGMLAGLMRSPSRQILRQTEQAEIVAYAPADGQSEPQFVGASQLLGVKTLSSSSLVFSPAARFEEEDAAGEEPFATPGVGEPVSAHQRILSAISGARAQGEDARQVLEPAAARVSPGPEVVVEEEEEEEEVEGETAPGMPSLPTYPGLEELREILEGGRSIDAWGNRSLEEMVRDVGGGSTEEGEEEASGDEEEDRDVRGLAREVLGVEIPPIDHLSTRANSKQVYGNHMRRGEQLLADARWFRAEERFTAALAIVPGDALAAAGRVHAQLGAGMYLSAAVNLRNLLRAYPEFIPARFDERLVPHGDRLEVIVAQLRQRAERDSPIGRDAAFLLAYLGHQTADLALTRDGLATLERVENSLGLPRDPLHDAAEAVWLEGTE